MVCSSHFFFLITKSSHNPFCFQRKVLVLKENVKSLIFPSSDCSVYSNLMQLHSPSGLAEWWGVLFLKFHQSIKHQTEGFRKQAMCIVTYSPGKKNDQSVYLPFNYLQTSWPHPWHINEFCHISFPLLSYYMNLDILWQ